MEHFLKGITRLINCGTLTQKRRVKKYKNWSSKFKYKSPFKEHLLQENVPF